MSKPVGIGGVVAALSVTSDLTRGHPRGEAMRACLLATELARRASLDPLRVSDVYYSALMRFAGCAATSHEMAALLGGDDIAVRARGDLTDPTRPAEALRFIASLGHGIDRLRILGRIPSMAKIVAAGARADCEVGADLCGRLGLSEAVRRAVLDGFERFDGNGAPDGKAGPIIAEPARYTAVGYAAVMFDAVGGPQTAIDTVARWSGRALDPAIVAIFQDAHAELLRISAPDDLWAAVVDAEPEPRRTFLDEALLNDALTGFGDAADLKAPCFQGHSRGVARLAQTAATRMSGTDPTLVYRAGLLHDLGRVAVPTGVWERPGPLRAEDWELVRLHPYHSGRILAGAPVLAQLATIVSRHHERPDGSGYPAGVGGSELDTAARLLGAADVLHALGEPRPHRPPLDLPAAAKMLSGLALDRDAIRAVLDAADAPPPALPPLPADLTERELDILRRLAAGRTKRDIAAELTISYSTVHTHTVHIYDKCGVHTRASLAMFAMRHGLTTKID